MQGALSRREASAAGQGKDLKLETRFNLTPQSWPPLETRGLAFVPPWQAVSGYWMSRFGVGGSELLSEAHPTEGECPGEGTGLACSSQCSRDLGAGTLEWQRGYSLGPNGLYFRGSPDKTGKGREGLFYCLPWWTVGGGGRRREGHATDGGAACPDLPFVT